MSSKRSDYKLSNFHSNKKPLLCVICGSIARGFNFGVISCMSCKMFFRRNALTNINNFICYQEGNCEMTPKTRRYCSYCRLRTCFKMGMRRDFIRKKEVYSKPNIDTEQPIQMMYSKSIRPLDLLQWSDRSNLSNNDWFLLRQLSSIFDSLTDPVILKADEICQELSKTGIQPLKMRVKPTYVYDMSNIFADTILKFVQFIPQFISLPDLNKQTLLIRNTRPLIMFSSHYHLNLKALQNLIQTPYWIASLECVFLPPKKYLHDKVHDLVGEVSFLDPCLIKLILIILTFSINNIDHDDITITYQLNEYYHVLILYKIQNIYAELMWKYMIYKFGEKRTIHFFSDIIKTILHVQFFVCDLENSKMSFEPKFEENLTKLTYETLQLKLDNEL